MIVLLLLKLKQREQEPNRKTTLISHLLKLTLSMIMRTLVSLVLSPCQRQTYRGQGQKWDIELVTVKTPNLNQIKD